MILLDKIVTGLQFFSAECQDATFFGLKPWYEYLDFDDSCSLAAKFPQDLGLVAAAIVENLTRVGAMVAVAFVIVGGFKMMISQGNPEAFAGARRTLINALAGLAIAVTASIVISFLANRILQV